MSDLDKKTDCASLLDSITSASPEKKSVGHWIGRFSPEEYRSISLAFGSEKIEPKRLKYLMIAIGKGQLSIISTGRWNFSENRAATQDEYLAFLENEVEKAIEKLEITKSTL